MPAVSPDVAFCLRRVGHDRAGWDTLVVSGTADTRVPAEVVWAMWTELERWPAWSSLYRSVTRASTAELAAGSTFDQQLGLGFPIGTTSQHVTIDLLEPARRVSWSGESNGIKSCHLWSFTPSPDGGTHVSNVEVFTGVMIAMLRPLVARRWNRQFQAAVDGLIRSAARSLWTRPDGSPARPAGRRPAPSGNECSAELPMAYDIRRFFGQAGAAPPESGSGRSSAP